MPYAIQANAGASQGRITQRWYRWSPSKHRMKLSRYSARGTTHSRGIGATFWLRCVVVLTSSVDAQAARATHSAICPKVGRATVGDSGTSFTAPAITGGAVTDTGVGFTDHHAVTAHSSANAA